MVLTNLQSTWQANVSTLLQKCLPGKWLNDMTVSTFLQFALAHSPAIPNRTDFIILDSLFSSLTFRWTKRVKKAVRQRHQSGMSAAKYVIMPYNKENLHWVGLIFEIKTEEFSVLDSLGRQRTMHIGKFALILLGFWRRC